MRGMGNMASIKKIVFIGSKSFGLQTLKLLYTTTPELIQRVITCDDSDDERSCKQDFIDFAADKKIELSFSNSKKRTHELLKESAPDLCFVNGWYQIFSAETLALAKRGFIGIHHSLLPKYRGGSPLVWQLINREKKIGSSLFYLSDGMDSGDILFQVFIENQNLYINDAREKIEYLLLQKLREVWLDILNDKVKGVAQRDSEASYCAQLLPVDGRINWNESAATILAKIRAQSVPYPCAYCFDNDRKVKIISARFSEYKYYGIPGQIVAFEKKTGNPIIACGDNSALLLEKYVLDVAHAKCETQVLCSLKTRLV